MNKTNETKIKTVHINEKLAAEKNVEPVMVNKDNGTQTFEGTVMEKVTAPIQVEGAAKMDNAEFTEDNVDYIETPVVIREKRIISTGGSKEGLKAIIENYKVSNPTKYEAKKAELEKKLSEAK